MKTTPQSNNWALLTLIVCMLILIFFFPSYGWRLRSYLTPQTVGPAVDATSTLATENAALKAELAKLQSVSLEIPRKPQNYLRAMVFSRYPLNFKNEMLIDAGGNEGVKSGAAVVFQGIFIGKVQSVFPDTALVETVFDNDFKLPVRIGPHAYDGLLMGGSYPSIHSIGKNSAVNGGDAVIAAAPGVPYGLPIGEIATTSISSDDLFQQATLSFSYDANSIRTVLVAD